MVDLMELKLEFQVSIEVCGEMDWEEIVQYDGNVEDYVEDNLENLDKEYHVNEEGLNVVSDEELSSIVNNHDRRVKELGVQIKLQKDQLNTLSETVISLNEQLAQLRGN